MKILGQLWISWAMNSYQFREKIKNFIRVQHFQDEIKFLREEVGNKNEIVKTLIKNINCLKIQFSQNQNSSYNSYQKSLKPQNENIDSQDNSSFITPTKKIKIK